MARGVLFLVIGTLCLAAECDREDMFPRTQINLEVRHHERILSEIDVQIYLNHTSRPTVDRLDKYFHVESSDAAGKVVMDQVPLGNHWLIALGYDPAIGEQVVGHMAIRLDRAHLQIDTIMYVGEEDYYRID